MNKQIKVEHTKTINTIIRNWDGKKSREIVVAEGNLVLIEFKDVMPYSNQIGRNKFTGNLFIATTTNKFGGYLVKPIIISETEKIEVGDWHINMYANKASRSIQQYTEIRHLKNAQKDYRFPYQRKILALPEHFSPEQLQMIVDGTLKDGDKVLVECVLKNINISNNGHLGGYTKENVPFIKLNSSNHITLHKVEEKMYTREEIRNKVESFRIHNTDGNFHEGMNWVIDKILESL